MITALDPIHIMRALDILRHMDFRAAYQAFRDADIEGELRTIDDIMRIIGVFFPPIALAEHDISIIAPVVLWMIQNGKPGEAKKPEGSDNVTTP